MKVIKAAPIYRYQFDDNHLNFIDKLFIQSKYNSSDFYQRMFNEDFVNIFRSTSRQKENIFSIESNDNELIQRLFENIRTRYNTNCIDEIVRELVEEIAQSLVWFGRAYYFLQDLPEKKKIYIKSFNTNGIFRFFKTYCQWIPKRREEYHNSNIELLPREIRILDKNKLMCFSMPKSIRQILSAQNRTLAALDKHQYDGIQFYPKATHENPTPKNDFDFRVWQDTKEQILYRATRDMGWNGRNSDSSKISEFFVYQRLIRFRRNQLILRNHILGQLSSEFTRVGRQYNAEFHITILPTNNLPQVDKLDDLEIRLSREEVSFSEVLDFCYERKTYHKPPSNN